MSDERATFVVRLHHAERAGTHHDFHLDGESWAIPKGMPTAISQGKRLAVKTAHHSHDEARFEGAIPKGQYGAGTCEVIDEGEVIIIDEYPGHYFFNLQGNLFGGNYCLRHWKDNKWLIWRRP